MISLSLRVVPEAAEHQQHEQDGQDDPGRSHCFSRRRWSRPSSTAAQKMSPIVARTTMREKIAATAKTGLLIPRRYPVVPVSNRDGLERVS